MEGILMGAVGPDDDFGSDNVVPFGDYVPKQKKKMEEKKEVELAAILSAGSRRIRSVIDVMESDEKLDFIIKDLLPDVGLLYIGGLSGTGKTILAIQTVGNVILGRPTMTWELGNAGNDVTALFLSLEMPAPELQLRLKHIYPNLSDDEKKVFQERFLSYSEPEPFKLWDASHMLELIEMIKATGTNLLLIDSASVSFAEELTNQAQVNKSIDNLRMIRAKYSVAMIIVCHTRKPPQGIASNPEDATLNELFGHSGVAQSASSIIIMLEDEKTRKEVIRSGKQDESQKCVHIVNAKQRFGANGGAFKSMLTSKREVDSGQPLMFRRNAIPIAMTDEQRDRVRRIKPPSMSEALGGIDFNALGGEEN